MNWNDIKIGLIWIVILLLIIFFAPSFLGQASITALIMLALLALLVVGHITHSNFSFYVAAFLMFLFILLLNIPGIHFSFPNWGF